MHETTRFAKDIENRREINKIMMRVTYSLKKEEQDLLRLIKNQKYIPLNLTH